VARILVFEPQRDIRALIEIVVARLGYESAVSEVPGDGSDDLDAAVIDVDGVDGLALGWRLRAVGVPVVLTSIYPASTEMSNLSPAAYLIKPFSLHSLAEALSDAVGSADASNRA
jgi:DNA-binding response OmpR family regulator